MSPTPDPTRTRLSISASPRRVKKEPTGLDERPDGRDVDVLSPSPPKGNSQGAQRSPSSSRRGAARQSSNSQPAAVRVAMTTASTVDEFGNDDDALFDLRTPTPPPRPASRQPTSASRSNTDATHANGTSKSPRSQRAAPRSSASASAAASASVPENVPAPSRSSGMASSTSSNLNEQSTKSLNQMLISNMQRKDHVQEQLLQLLEGNAPPGTDPEWLRSSKAFLVNRIDEIRGILESRGGQSFSQHQQSQQQQQRRRRRPSPAAVQRPRTTAARASRPVSVSPIAIPTSSIKAFSEDEGEDGGAAHATPSPSPKLVRQTQRNLVDASPSVRQRNKQRSREPAVSTRSTSGGHGGPSSQRAPAVSSSQRALPSAATAAPIDDFSSLDPAFFDDDEEMLMAEIQGEHAFAAQTRAPPAAPASASASGSRRMEVIDVDRPIPMPARKDAMSRSDSASTSTSAATTTTTTAANAPPRPTLRDQMNYVWSRDVAKALRRTFGLQEFRNNQLEAINATLNGDDVFCLMPTGGGKSLCYQLPALIDSGRTQGVTVVISPLLSLIHDQVRHLLDLTIPALMLTGDMTGPKRDFALSELFSKTPTTRLLYLTPEFVGRSRQAEDIFAHLDRHNLLARFVIDEAHCVSQWGHDFRPDYKQLHKLRDKYPQIPIMAMTATANSRVKADVIASLKIKGCKTLQQSFNRANLRYEVREKNQKTVVADIAKFIQASHRGQCGIVYCLSRRACEEVAEKLTREHGLQAQHYHAALSKTDRLAIQEAWQSGKFQIIVATIAFGMGIDKGDVRFVVHHTIPQSLEGYYQETGRAGRDGKSSSCALFFTYKDTMVIKRMIDDGEGTADQKEQQHANLRRVVQYCMNKHDCRRAQVLQYFGEVFPAEACHHTCDNCRNSAANHRMAVEQDLTSVAKQAVELVSDLNRHRPNDGSGFTMLHFVDVFRGSQSRAIRDRGHHDHRLAGAGSTLNRGDVERLFQDLTIRNVLNERSTVNKMGFAHAYLELGTEASALLNGLLRIVMSVQRSSTGSGAADSTSAAARAPQRNSTGNNNNNKNKRVVGTVRRSDGLDDSEFEVFDAFDISNVNLSPEPARTSTTTNSTAAAMRTPTMNNRQASTLRRGGSTSLMRTNSFDVGQAIITGQRSVKVGTSRALANENGHAQYDASDDGGGGDHRQRVGGSSRAAILSAGKNTSSSSSDLTTECLAELTRLRDDLARRNQCIKAAIFDNVTLQRMAEQLPTGIASFVAIHGVGDDKYESFGREFLGVCKSYALRRDAGLGKFAYGGGGSGGSSGSHSGAAARKRARMSDGSVVVVAAGSGGGSGGGGGSAPRPSRKSMI